MLIDSPAVPDGPVLVIGGAGMDIVARLRDDLHPGSSAPAQIRTSVGGVARNVAENLARLGQQVNLISAVGRDSAGERILNQVESAGVDVSAVVCADHLPTGAYIGLINQNGELVHGVDDMRVMRALTPAYIRAQVDLFKEAAMLFVDANIPKDTLRTVFSLARRARLPICADPTAAGLAARLTRYLDRLMLITPNITEAATYCEQSLEKILTRRQALSAAKFLVSRGVRLAVITMAERGLCYASSETSGYIPAIRTEIVDPTGAGDALSAAIIFALLNEIPLDDAVRLGVSAASLTLRHAGTVVPDLSLEKLYDQLVI